MGYFTGKRGSSKKQEKEMSIFGRIIIVVILSISAYSMGFFDFMKSDESWCMDKVMQSGTNSFNAAQVCSNPSPSKSCMKKVMENNKPFNAAKACKGK